MDLDELATRLDTAVPEGSPWSVVRRLGGESGGAALVRAGDGREWVAKRSGSPRIVERVQRAREHGVPAPDVRRVAADLVVYPALAGRRHPTLTVPLAQSLVDAVRGLRGLGAPEPGWSPMLRRSLTTGLDGFCEHGALLASGGDAGRLVERIRAIGADVPEPAAGDLVHFDLHPGNVLSVDGATVSGVIDWDSAQDGDGAFDLAYLAVSFELFGAGGEPLDVLWRALADDRSPATAGYVAHSVLRLADWRWRHHPAMGPAAVAAGHAILDRHS